MKPIKFQVFTKDWEGVEKCFDAYSLMLLDDGRYRVAFTNSDNDKEFVTTEQDKIRFFAGLMDDNGKELYSGDILQVSYMGFTQFLCQVCYGEYHQDGSGGEYSSSKCIGFYAKALSPYELDEDESLIVPDYLRETSILNFESVKLIGNIYENPIEKSEPVEKDKSLDS